jgi:hypothetical protein
MRGLSSRSGGTPHPTSLRSATFFRKGRRTQLLKQLPARLSPLHNLPR